MTLFFLYYTMKKVDIIIPTIMNTRAEVFGYILIQLNECEYVNKIIVIDNTLDQSFKTKLGILANPLIIPKLVIKNGVINGKAGLVNASWNKGMLEAQESTNTPYYCLLNDDIILNKYVIESVMRAFSCHPNISLMTVATMNNVPIEQYLKEYDKPPGRLTDDIPNGRQGWIMFGKKKQFELIPSHRIKLFYGDDWIYRKAHNLGRVTMLTNPMVSHFQSTSVNKNMDRLKSIIDQDTIEWRQMCKDGYV